MFSRDERRALIFLAVIAAAGGVMRVVRAADAPPGAPLAVPDLPAGDLQHQRELTQAALQATRPLLPGERIDIDTAGEAQIERLPRVGPALARRIVEERTAHGPFGSLEGLRRVPGIGPATLKGFERTVSFSGTPWAHNDPIETGRGTRGVGSGKCPPPAGVLSLNYATEAELACLPGLGPERARAIVTWRTAHIMFTKVEDLEQVPGFGVRRFARLAPLVRVP